MILIPNSGLKVIILKQLKEEWFAYFSSEHYSDSPNFYSSENFDWAKAIEANSNEIATEITRIINSENFTPKGYFIKGLTVQSGWKTFSFLTWGIKINEALTLTPVFNNLLAHFPEIVSISINILEAGEKIKAHHGDSNTFYRCHLGIDIPQGLQKCGFRVNNQDAEWKNNKLLIFNDANKHEAWNLSDKKRVIVVFDVIRSEYKHKKKAICLKIRSFLILQLLFEQYSFIKKMPKWIHRIINSSIFILLFLLYPYQKKHGVIKKHN